jgi:DNA-binding NarL/FixJ family response regulator
MLLHIPAKQLSMTITLFLAMRNEAFIRIFANIMAHKIGAKLVGSCNPLQEVDVLYFTLRPDILIIDIKSDSMYSFDIIRSILKKDANAKIIGITSNFHQHVKLTLQQIGAKGYFLRNEDIDKIEKIITEVHTGSSVFTTG